jgi:hypothetical protein
MNMARDDQALGFSRGGFGTKIHVGVDTLGQVSPRNAGLGYVPDALTKFRL